MKNNPKTIKKLRIIGFLLLIIGIVFVIVGIISVSRRFSNFPDFDIKKKSDFSFLIPIGIITLFSGIICLSYGYMGAMNRFVANETVPTASKAINHVLEENKDNLKDILGNSKDSKTKKRVCNKCGAVNEIDDKYCFDCGNKLIEDKQ